MPKRKYQKSTAGIVGEATTVGPLDGFCGPGSAPAVQNSAAPIALDKRRLKILEFCHVYGIGKTRAYAEMNAGRLRFGWNGNQRRIHVDDAETYARLAQQPPIKRGG